MFPPPVFWSHLTKIDEASKFSVHFIFLAKNPSFISLAFLPLNRIYFLHRFCNPFVCLFAATQNNLILSPYIQFFTNWEIKMKMFTSPWQRSPRPSVCVHELAYVAVKHCDLMCAQQTITGIHIPSLSHILMISSIYTHKINKERCDTVFKISFSVSALPNTWRRS